MYGCYMKLLGPVWLYPVLGYTPITAVGSYISAPCLTILSYSNTEWLGKNNMGLMIIRTTRLTCWIPDAHFGLEDRGNTQQFDNGIALDGNTRHLLVILFVFKTEKRFSINIGILFFPNCIHVIWMLPKGYFHDFKGSQHGRTAAMAETWSAVRPHKAPVPQTLFFSFQESLVLKSQ